MSRKYWGFVIINLILINTMLMSKLDVINEKAETFDINREKIDLTLLGGWSYNFGYEDIHKLLLEEEYIFAAMGEEGLVIINATEPTALHTISSYQINGSIVDVYKMGDILFILLENIGVEFIDIQNIENPTKVGEYIPSGEISCIYVKDNYLFVGNFVGGDLEIGEVQAVDISNLNEPLVLMKFERHFETFTKIRCNENILCLMSASNILFLNFSKFITANEGRLYLGAISGNGFSDIAINGSVFYTCFNGDLRTFDINDISNIEAILWLVDGSHYSLYFTIDSLYTRGRTTINIFAIPEKSNILKLNYEINNSILRDLVVEDSYIATANIGEGDDILLFKQTRTVIEEPKNPIWYYIVGPIGGAIIIGVTVFGVITIRKKRMLETPSEN